MANTFPTNYIQPATEVTSFDTHMCNVFGHSFEKNQRVIGAMYAWRTSNFEMIEKLLNDSEQVVRMEAVRYAGLMGLYSRLVEIGTAKEEREEVKQEAMFALAKQSANASQEARIVAEHLLDNAGWQVRNSAERELYMLNRQSNR